MEACNYNVLFDEYSERHFMKRFAKEHGRSWDKTKLDIVAVCEHIDTMLLYKRVDPIKEVGGNKLVKLDFAVEGTRVSPKASGNRCILWVNEDEKTVRVMLVYGKGDVCSKHETVWWKQEICRGINQAGEVFKL